MIFADAETIGAIRDIALAAFTFFGTVFAAWMTYLMRKMPAATASRICQANTERENAADERAMEAARTGPPPIIESPPPGELK